MKRMTQEQYESEREKFPQGLVIFHDKLMVDKLYDPEKRQELPEEILVLDRKLAAIYREIGLYDDYCAECAVDTTICAETRDFCLATKDRRKLEEEAEELEARIKSVLMLNKMLR